MDREPAAAGRIVVLAGGLSHERDVSLRSGRRVAEALRAAGVEVEERDVDAGLVPALRRGSTRLRRTPPARRVRRGRRAPRGARAAGRALRRVAAAACRTRVRQAGRPRPSSPAPGCATPAVGGASARDVPGARRGGRDGRDHRRARAAAGGEAGAGRLGAGLHRGPGGRRAGPGHGRCFAYGRHRAGRAVRRRHRGRGDGGGHRRRASRAAGCVEIGRTAGSTTTPPATPPGAPSSWCRPSSRTRWRRECAAGRGDRASRSWGCATCPART